MAAHGEALTRVRAQRAEQNASRSIRSQQDSAYERSLAVDRERKRKAEEEKKEKERAEKAALEAEAAEQRYQANLAAWRAESPLPAMYRRQLEHLVLGIWNRDARGRWQRLAVAYPVAPGAPGPEHEDVGRQVRPPLADFWAGEAGADGVIQRWGGSPAPGGGSPAPGHRSQARP